MVLSCCLLKLYAGVILRGSEEVLSAIGALGPVPVLAFGAHCLGTAHLVGALHCVLWLTSLKLSGLLHDTRLRMSSIHRLTLYFFVPSVGLIGRV
jgi:hypothetical protein